MSKSLLSNILIYGKGLLSSRVLGLIRDLAIGLSLGINAKSDILLVALTIPDFIANVSLGGGLQLSLLPYFQKLGTGNAFGKLQQTLKNISFVVVPFFALLFIFKADIIKVFLPAFTIDEVHSQLSQMSIGLLLLISALMIYAAPMRSFLQANKDFKSLGLENVLFNIAIISGVLFHHITGLRSVLLLSIFFGFSVRLIWLFINVLKVSNQNMNPIIEEEPASVKDTTQFPFKEASYSHLFSMALISMPVIIRSFSTYLGDGWATKFIFANRLVDAAMLIFTTVIGSVLFSELPKMLKDSRQKTIKIFSFASLYLLPALALLGFTITYLAMMFLEPTSEAYGYLYILVALSVFIPARLAVHYYNLILIADDKSAVSAAVALASASISFAVYKIIKLDFESAHLIVMIQAVVIYPLCLLMLMHFAWSYRYFKHTLFFCMVYGFVHICFITQKTETLTPLLIIGVATSVLSGSLLWKKRKFIAT
jgi:peptidoglycan biosynthesis protein MviN/MurJ (putative lipid II flippase)